jgi:hypothetical protein
MTGIFKISLATFRISRCRPHEGRPHVATSGRSGIRPLDRSASRKCRGFQAIEENEPPRAGRAQHETPCNTASGLTPPIASRLSDQSFSFALAVFLLSGPDSQTRVRVLVWSRIQYPVPVGAWARFARLWLVVGDWWLVVLPGQARRPVLLERSKPKWLDLKARVARRGWGLGLGARIWWLGLGIGSRELMRQGHGLRRGWSRSFDCQRSGGGNG